MREYELMVIINPEVEDRAVEPTLKKFLEVVTKDNWTVDNVDILGRCRLAYELLGGLRGRGKPDDRVDTLGLLLDLVGEAPTSPDVHLVHSAAAVADDIEELLECLVDGAFLDIGVDDYHQLISTHV